MPLITMQSEPENDRSIAAEIARALAERIVSGVLAGGVPLRQEHVAAEFRASHVPVREAFRRLEAQGLVVSEPRRGVRVAPLDAATIREVTEMRAALETLALRHALPHIAMEDVAEAEAALRQARASADIAVWEATNRRFHRALTRPCRMPRLLAAIDDLHRASARFLFVTWKDLGWQPQSEAEHQGILDSVAQRNEAEAERLLGAHIRAAGHSLAAALDDGAHKVAKRESRPDLSS